MCRLFYVNTYASYTLAFKVLLNLEFPIWFSSIFSISGYESMAMCVNGVCAANAVTGVTNACKYLCGKDSCLDAVNAGTCDLTKVLNADYSGAKYVCINGILFIFDLVMQYF